MAAAAAAVLEAADAAETAASTAAHAFAVSTLEVAIEPDRGKDSFTPLPSLSLYSPLVEVAGTSPFCSRIDRLAPIIRLAFPNERSNGFARRIVSAVGIISSAVDGKSEKMKYNNRLNRMKDP